LARWGWQHRVDAALAETDFGAWDGQAWSDIGQVSIDAWCADFLRHAPGGGEPLQALLARVQAFDPGHARVVVTHGGWLSAARWWVEHGDRPPSASSWPLPPKHAVLTVLQGRRG
ncbi:MAG: histidine phosphatase family protein, partial [Rubrivivax sp.]|nr:histidine phosphatase family protein [Rubrivivax sp.]